MTDNSLSCATKRGAPMQKEVIRKLMESVTPFVWSETRTLGFAKGTTNRQKSIYLSVPVFTNTDNYLVPIYLRGNLIPLITKDL